MFFASLFVLLGRNVPREFSLLFPLRLLLFGFHKLQFQVVSTSMKSFRRDYEKKKEKWSLRILHQKGGFFAAMFINGSWTIQNKYIKHISPMVVVIMHPFYSDDPSSNPDEVQFIIKSKAFAESFLCKYKLDYSQGGRVLICKPKM